VIELGWKTGEERAMQTSKDEMYHGLVIAESLRADADIQLGEGTRLERVQRVAITHPAPGQPDTWTLLTVSLPARLGSSLVAWLERSLIAGPWYADLDDSTHHYVVFSGRTFRYSLDDPKGPEEARRYGQLLGIPHDQLDWDGS
jgi:hypothetical protein